MHAGVWAASARGPNNRLTEKKVGGPAIADKQAPNSRLGLTSGDRGLTKALEVVPAPMQLIPI